jgi:hypothetical protein
MNLRDLQIHPNPADQAGIFICFGRVADEIGWFIERKQPLVFVHDLYSRIWPVHFLSAKAEYVCSHRVKEKRNLVFMTLLGVAFALSRVPGVLPENFSAVYAFVFCAGLFFGGFAGWAFPLGTVLVTDLLLNAYYYFFLNIPLTFGPLIFNYLAYFALVYFGRRLRPHRSPVLWVGGGILGALFFYLFTNTAAWLFNPFNNPEYVKSFQGWLVALTKGTAGYPETWKFFRNTLLSGGLFTALFIVGRELVAPEPKEAPEPAEESNPPAEASDEPNKA